MCSGLCIEVFVVPGLQYRHTVPSPYNAGRYLWWGNTIAWIVVADYLLLVPLIWETCHFEKQVLVCSRDRGGARGQGP